MNIKVDGKEIELEYSFNSFKYMEDFNVLELQEIESKPFKVLKIVSQLLFGAMNHNPKAFYSFEQVDAVVEQISMDGMLTDSITELVALLEASDFFKALQGSTQK